MARSTEGAPVTVSANAHYSDEPAVEGRWSARRTLAFAVVSSAALWSVIIASGAALIP